MPAGMLPNAEQTRCAFMLTPASGTAPSTGATYTTPFSTTIPPIVFVGKGAAGGGIPGADHHVPRAVVQILSARRMDNSEAKKSPPRWRAESISEETWRRQDEL
jgi:hypothetical protein